MGCRNRKILMGNIVLECADRTGFGQISCTSQKNGFGTRSNLEVGKCHEVALYAIADGKFSSNSMGL